MHNKKSLGQNFLIDEKVIRNITNSFFACEDDLIIEIGPGRGALTRELKKFKANILCYEIDMDLKNTLSILEDNKTKIIYTDFLKSNIKEDIKNYKYKNIYLVGNLPYYITTPILEHIINENITFKEMIIMVQKEVANRFMAQPKTKEYGYFTLYLANYFNIYKVLDVPKICFSPVPKVNSEVIKIIPKTLDSIDQKKYFTFLKLAFNQKRKTLKNNIGSILFNRIYPILKANNYNENVRAEEIPEDIFKELIKFM